MRSTVPANLILLDLFTLHIIFALIPLLSTYQASLLIQIRDGHGFVLSWKMDYTNSVFSYAV
jgi:hypothetical protein